ncbi:MAG: carbonic anhydrase [Candidatus Omnitrophica bacterium]|nr:carbonic anhydrase [Candidatus Omnitrophota bacterium]
MDAEQALQRLKEGNQRFASGRRTYPRQDLQRMRDIEQKQNPYATLLSCSDSRVPPEHLFDAGLGDLFVVRVAGNVFDDIAFGAIEFGVEYIETPLLVVLGHTNCGAISAAVREQDAHSYVSDLLEKVNHAIEEAKQKHPELNLAQLIDAAIRYNVLRSMEDLVRQSPLIRRRVENRRLSIMGAVYHIENGAVEWLGKHPRQEEFLME